MPFEVLDLNKICIDYFKPLVPPEKKKYIDFDSVEVNLDYMTVMYDETKYFKKDAPPTPTAHILYRANFVNKTPRPQTYVLMTERETSSSCELDILKTFSFGGEVGVGVEPPGAGSGLKVTFKAEKSKQKGTTITNEQELTWAIDTNVTVPPGHQTRAELIVKEEDYGGDFEVVCTFEGTASVTFFHIRDKDAIHVEAKDVVSIFTPKHGFLLDGDGRPTFVIKGVCKCRVGVEQLIDLQQSVIEETEAKKK
ncbi:uncharacterized protein LOC131927991 [Physella acuta]|uniref:uncharacterized protein LOC131927991 n=1 Tax=Physella acuta TaxID=109671 RepID=UPI0027DCAA10|nr:uncharacterized protein LOC131927991 [Physella acuta]XP_059139859.1 uncharacterized protein LOC131927991 [Physella acuta]